MTAQATAFDIGDQARASIADVLDRQLWPLGPEAIEALAPAPGLHSLLRQYGGQKCTPVHT